MNLLYYITSHGYGHGVRSCAICNRFSSDVRLIIRTTLPEQFLREEVQRQFTYAPASFDCGCIQKDGITVDIEATLRTYSEIADANQGRLRDEARWCRDRRIDGIISDIVPFAFDVAAERGIPSIACTNFTWYDIYADYADGFPRYRSCIQEALRQYQNAGMLLAMTPANPMPYFAKRIAVPMVGRTGVSRRERIRAHYGIASHKRLALIYLGAFGLDTADFSRLRRFHNWEFFGLGPLPRAPGNYHGIDKSVFTYEDCTASADLTVSKIGYGTVAECMLNGSPLLYLPRLDFAEYPVLEAAVRAWGHGYCLPAREYASLAWDEVLASVSSRARPAPLDSDGAEACARHIERIMAGGVIQSACNPS
jgi:hypothetical protein